jgi:succinate dehydrogenase / fumarate reductase iron-sulfur subunit
MKSGAAFRTVRVFRYDPETGGEGRFAEYSLDIERPEMTTLLDVLLRIRKEQDPTLAFRFACRVNMCGSCGMVINGREALACKTNVSDLPEGKDITLRPLNHFPIIKDLMVDMGPFFDKYIESLPFFEPKEKRDEPCVIRPDSPARLDIGMATDCIACGCCVSSCTMVDNHEGYAGPAALNRAFTLLADERDALFIPRLTRALESCYNCRTEFNCTEVCPKQISGTYAIKYIQRLALRRLPDVRPLPHPAEDALPLHVPAGSACRCKEGEEADPSRRAFLKNAAGFVGVGTVLGLSGILGVASIGPTLPDRPKQWVNAGSLSSFPADAVSTVMLHFERSRGFHAEQVTRPLLVRRDGTDGFICFDNSCPHLGCAVSWDPALERFKCACHGGAFDPDGKVLAGPPPRPLERLEWKVEGGVLKVEVA